jgi:uncharacterized MAPEG superfamily protein
MRQAKAIAARERWAANDRSAVAHFLLLGLLVVLLGSASDPMCLCAWHIVRERAPRVFMDS